MIANKLNFGDEIRVIAPSRSLSIIWQEVFDKALKFLTNKGFKISFSKNCSELDEIDSSSIHSRIEDLHDAFLDKNVKAILTCIGGFNVNQILEYIDYSLIKRNPKIICGFSDITALLNSIYAKTGLITYHGPHFSSFGFNKEIEYTNAYFEKCLLKNETFIIEPSKHTKEYYVIQEGFTQGKIVGGNLCTLNLLQGTEFMPDLGNKILFLEDDNIVGDYFRYEFERNLQSLIQTSGFDEVKGIVIGRFEDSCKMDINTIRRMISTKKQLKNVPIISNVDFGHEFPFATFPIGGVVKIEANASKVSLEVVEH
ncbi:muramoyltetrapeptide carboxypeptidase [Paenibacillus uliginis N3/975]|uniref:Muramoyltetrapeptide carboxypeptidase n=1 Tax=Paenibacillus uliginis N3/975 TaxID=1313296 RepID=A0A1X7HFT3_9BACL|nr:S66 peptidase family protein [Paenibacillus uliginis]SMF85814.1 muramoyltetrapeptide carboxypeptidase [Paenibacillus uliginis N3/975]